MLKSEISTQMEFKDSVTIHGDLTGGIQTIGFQIIGYTDAARSGKVIKLTS